MVLANPEDYFETDKNLSKAGEIHKRSYWNGATSYESVWNKSYGDITQKTLRTYLKYGTRKHHVHITYLLANIYLFLSLNFSILFDLIHITFLIYCLRSYTLSLLRPCQDLQNPVKFCAWKHEPLYLFHPSPHGSVIAYPTELWKFLWKVSIWQTFHGKETCFNIIWQFPLIRELWKM